MFEFCFLLKHNSFKNSYIVDDEYFMFTIKNFKKIFESNFHLLCLRDLKPVLVDLSWYDALEQLQWLRFYERSLFVYYIFVYVHLKIGTKVECRTLA